MHKKLVGVIADCTHNAWSKLYIACSNHMNSCQESSLFPDLFMRPISITTWLPPQLRNLSKRVTASIREMGEAAAPRQTLEQQRTTLPSVGCWSPQCRNVMGPAEDTLHMLSCSGCTIAQYCTAACQKAH